MHRDASDMFLGALDGISDPETKRKAIESGAAALFLAGYGPTLTGSPASSRFKERERESERRARRAPAKPRRSPRPRKEKDPAATLAN